MIFYDTSSLLKKGEDLFDDFFIISSITLNELEHIKTSGTKDSSVKFAARQLLRRLDQNPTLYKVENFTNFMLEPFQMLGLDITNDIKILATAYTYKNTYDSSLFFYTNDLALKNIAKLFFESSYVNSVEEKNIITYNGYIEKIMSDEEMTEFYSNSTKNIYNLYINQYINIYDKGKNLVDTLCWTGEEYRHLTYGNFNSKWFGKIKPFKGDIYQAMAADSFLNNKITMVKGSAGSGKTMLSLSYLLHLLDKGEIDKIIVFCNTVATKDSAKLGYYPGTRDEKLLDSQIGNLLSSKIGDRIEVERMLQQGQLVLLPLSDIRGFDTSGMNAGIYISEAQNMSIDLMKLALQRIGNDSICIIDGDEKTQVDHENFAGANNGMKRVSQVFKGENIYGEVELKIIHRSRIAQIAEKL